MVGRRSGSGDQPTDGEKRKLIERLKAARTYLGVSQDKVAAYLGVGRSAISEIESGKRNVTAVELQRLAKLYQKSVSWFTDDVVEGVPPDVEYLARTASDLSENDRTELRRFAEFLKAKSEADHGEQ